MYGWGRFPKYMPVDEIRTKAAKKIASLKKSGQKINPVIIKGKNIASTFWGKAWCKNMESYSDYENRLPRGRVYVRHGSVIDLNIEQGKIEALVNGASLYKITIIIKPVPDKKWKNIVKACSGKIDCLIELLQGKLSKSVMKIITCKEQGLFPRPNEIKLKCSCPDYASMCKHIAAAMYAVGARLDTQPQDLFILRHVAHTELITADTTSDILMPQGKKSKILEDTDLSVLFGIDIQEALNKPKRIRHIKRKSSARNEL